MPDRIIRLLALDSFGTLFDVQTGLIPSLTEAGMDNPAGFAAAWFARVKQTTQTVNASGRFQPFHELTKLALVETAAERRIRLTEAQQAASLAAWRRLPLFNDVKDALQTWRDSGAVAWIITNGDLDTIQALLEVHGIAELVSGVYTASAAEAYKPSKAIYTGAAAAAGVLPAQVVMASALPLDVDGAKSAGMQTAWIRRVPSESAPHNPDWTVDGLQELISLLQPLLPRPNPGDRAF